MLLASPCLSRLQFKTRGLMPLDELSKLKVQVLSQNVEVGVLDSSVASLIERGTGVRLPFLCNEIFIA
jgi:hypothetical protein